MDTFQTALNADEIVTEIHFALPPAHTGSAYSKLENKASHYAITGSAAVISQGEDGTCSAASLTITGAASRITRASTAEAALLGKKLDEATIAEAASHAAEGLDLISDIHGSTEYRRQMRPPGRGDLQVSHSIFLFKIYFCFTEIVDEII